MLLCLGDPIAGVHLDNDAQFRVYSENGCAYDVLDVQAEIVRETIDITSYGDFNRSVAAGPAHGKFKIYLALAPAESLMTLLEDGLYIRERFCGWNLNAKLRVLGVMVESNVGDIGDIQRVRVDAISDGPVDQVSDDGYRNLVVPIPVFGGVISDEAEQTLSEAPVRRAMNLKEKL